MCFLLEPAVQHCQQPQSWLLQSTGHDTPLKPSSHCETWCRAHAASVDAVDEAAVVWYHSLRICAESWTQCVWPATLSQKRPLSAQPEHAMRVLCNTGTAAMHCGKIQLAHTAMTIAACPTAKLSQHKLSVSRGFSEGEGEAGRGGGGEEARRTTLG